MLAKLYQVLFTRCAYCGGHFSWGYAPLVVDGYQQSDVPSSKIVAFFKGERDHVHYADCCRVVLVARKFQQLTTDREPLDTAYERSLVNYYGCYPWWRECVLGEDFKTSVARAAEHVQRGLTPCSGCDGEGQLVVDAVMKDDPSAPILPGTPRDAVAWIVGACEKCDGTGYPRIKNSITDQEVMEAVRRA